METNKTIEQVMQEQCDARINEAEDHSLYTALRTMLWTFLAMVQIFAIIVIADDRFNIISNLTYNLDYDHSIYDVYDISMWVGILIGVLVCTALVSIAKVVFYVKNA